MTDRIAVLAQFLAANLGWLRHRAKLDEFARDIADAAGRMRGLVNGPGEQKYLGPCGARLTMACETCEREISVGEAYAPQPGTGGLVDCAEHTPFIGDIRLRQTDTCQGDVYAYRGASAGRCRLCGAEVSTRDREAWLDGEVRDRAFRASEIAAAYGLKANTIRVWHARGRLHEVSRDHEDRPLFNVGDVLDLAAADAIRRHEAAVKRARRQAQHEPA